MATGLLPSGTLAVKAAASSSSNNKWLAPIFGFSSDPGYIDSAGGSSGKVAYPRKADLEGSGSSLSAAGRPRPDPIRFTEEKARLLRLMTSDAASRHDAMYHSAIASRLASDFGNRTDL